MKYRCSMSQVDSQVERMERYTQKGLWHVAVDYIMFRQKATVCSYHETALS